MSEARCFKHCTEFTLPFSLSVLAFPHCPHSRGAPALWLFWSRRSHAGVQLYVSGHASLTLYSLAHSIATNGFLRGQWERMKGAGASGNHLQLSQRRSEELTETNPSSNSRLQTSLFATLLGLINQKSLRITWESRTRLSSRLSSVTQEFNFLIIPGGLRMNFVLNY